MSGKVSVLLPNLNYREFLDDRMSSILNQTYENWELIVVDSYSNDGAWELFQEYARRDQRIKASQAPKGLYQSWNRCLEKATGDYVYIATSDDTMRIDALELMTQALYERPDCGICDSRLKIIDKMGSDVPYKEKELSISEYLQESNLLQVRHVRKWPHDFMLYFAGATVYTSMAQVLIRKSIVDQVGAFATDWGSVADYHWGMRAAGVTNTIYLPEQLTTWRKHGGEATVNSSGKQDSLRNTWHYQMADSALEFVGNSRRLSTEELSRFELEKSNLQAAAYLDAMKNGKLIDVAPTLKRMYSASPFMTNRLVFNNFHKKLRGKDYYSPGNLMRAISKRHALNEKVEIL